MIETTDDGRCLAQTLAGDNMKKTVDWYLRVCLWSWSMVRVDDQTGAGGSGWMIYESSISPPGLCQNKGHKT